MTRRLVWSIRLRAERTHGGVVRGIPGSLHLPRAPVGTRVRLGRAGRLGQRHAPHCLDFVMGQPRARDRSGAPVRCAHLPSGAGSAHRLRALRLEPGGVRAGVLDDWERCPRRQLYCVHFVSARRAGHGALRSAARRQWSSRMAQRTRLRPRPAPRSGQPAGAAVPEPLSAARVHHRDPLA